MNTNPQRLARDIGARHEVLAWRDASHFQIVRAYGKLFDQSIEALEILIKCSNILSVINEKYHFVEMVVDPIVRCLEERALVCLVSQRQAAMTRLWEAVHVSIGNQNVSPCLITLPSGSKPWEKCDQLDNLFKISPWERTITTEATLRKRYLEALTSIYRAELIDGFDGVNTSRCGCLIQKVNAVSALALECV